MRSILGTCNMMYPEPWNDYSTKGGSPRSICEDSMGVEGLVWCFGFMAAVQDYDQHTGSGRKVLNELLVCQHKFLDSGHKAVWFCRSVL